MCLLLGVGFTIWRETLQEFVFDLVPKVACQDFIEVLDMDQDAMWVKEDDVRIEKDVV